MNALHIWAASACVSLVLGIYSRAAWFFSLSVACTASACAAHFRLLPVIQVVAGGAAFVLVHSARLFCARCVFREKDVHEGAESVTDALGRVICGGAAWNAVYADGSPVPPYTRVEILRFGASEAVVGKTDTETCSLPSEKFAGMFPRGMAD